jgi:hypothetical protein
VTEQEAWELDELLTNTTSEVSPTEIISGMIRRENH